MNFIHLAKNMSPSTSCWIFFQGYLQQLVRKSFRWMHQRKYRNFLQKHFNFNRHKIHLRILNNLWIKLSVLIYFLKGLSKKFQESYPTWKLQPLLSFGELIYSALTLKQKANQKILSQP
ncbi:hypothetical protein FHG87_025917 [Trinorchestia longiramus]|nr:hypothetical protein FHG87_025917 [Trinorchestia longiramus]